mmetsp:Transcript_23966/g.57841  ORF Transcript_23966/g.57841 Transcript_23966/m.57841 type:complete len:192 (+) Transcript_23966:89-664(+)
MPVQIDFSAKMFKLAIFVLFLASMAGANDLLRGSTAESFQTATAEKQRCTLTVNCGSGKVDITTDVQSANEARALNPCKTYCNRDDRRKDGRLSCGGWSLQCGTGGGDDPFDDKSCGVICVTQTWQLNKRTLKQSCAQTECPSVPYRCTSETELCCPQSVADGFGKRKRFNDEIGICSRVDGSDGGDISVS